MSDGAKNQRTELITWWTPKRKGWIALAAVAYLASTLAPLFFYVTIRPGLPERGPYAAALLLYGCVVTFAPHVWFWVERSKFDEWCEGNFRNDPIKNLQKREDYKLHVDNARGIWTAVIALYAGVFLEFG